MSLRLRQKIKQNPSCDSCRESFGLLPHILEKCTRSSLKHDLGKLCESRHCLWFIRTGATQHRKIYEKQALAKFEEKLQKKVTTLFSFFHSYFLILESSPDNLVDNETEIIEVKCPY